MESQPMGSQARAHIYVLYELERNQTLYGARIQRMNRNEKIHRLRKTFPNATELLCIDQPNAINLHIRLKERARQLNLSPDCLKFAGNNIHIIDPTLTQANVIQMVNDVHNQRLSPLDCGIQTLKTEVDASLIDDSKFTKEQLTKHTVKALQQICRDRRFKGYSTKTTKNILIEFILKIQ